MKKKKDQLCSALTKELQLRYLFTVESLTLINLFDTLYYRGQLLEAWLALTVG